MRMPYLHFLCHKIRFSYLSRLYFLALSFFVNTGVGTYGVGTYGVGTYGVGTYGVGTYGVRHKWGWAQVSGHP